MGSLLEEEAIAELFGGAAAEGDDDAALAEEGGEGEGLEVTEVGFALLGEDLGDGAAVAGFDLVIEIEEAPAEAVGEESAGGGFAGAHEAGENDAVQRLGLGDCVSRDCASSGSWIVAGFGFRRHGLCWFGDGRCSHCRLREWFGEAKFVGGKRKTADPVGCGSVDGLGSLLVVIREAHNAAGPLGIPGAIAKSAGGGAQVHRD